MEAQERGVRCLVREGRGRSRSERQDDHRRVLYGRRCAWRETARGALPAPLVKGHAGHGGVPARHAARGGGGRRRVPRCRRAPREHRAAGGTVRLGRARGVRRRRDATIHGGFVMHRTILALFLFASLVAIGGTACGYGGGGGGQGSPAPSYGY